MRFAKTSRPSCALEPFRLGAAAIKKADLNSDLWGFRGFRVKQRLHVLPSTVISNGEVYGSGTLGATRLQAPFRPRDSLVLGDLNLLALDFPYRHQPCDFRRGEMYFQ